MSGFDLEAYVASFNARDYATISGYWDADSVVRFADVVLEGRNAILAFYAFFHEYVDERIEVGISAGSHDFLAAEVRVHLFVKRDLDRQRLEEAGYPSLLPLRSGDTAILPQFVHYRLRDGRIASAVCLIDHTPPLPDPVSLGGGRADSPDGLAGATRIAAEREEIV